MIGLKKGTVTLVPHEKEWDANAESIIKLLKHLLGDTVLDIQHIGSTSVFSIHAKPIIDIAVAVRDVNDILPYVEVLKRHNILLHEEVVAGQMFFVIENGDIRTHHIHVVKWNGTEWKNYIHFRDYLNANENVALQYEKLKEELESKYADDRVAYTKGKQNMINKILGK